MKAQTAEIIEFPGESVASSHLPANLIAVTPEPTSDNGVRNESVITPAADVQIERDSKVIKVTLRGKQGMVKIYPTTSKAGYSSYQVADYSTGKRKFHTFADYEKAEKKAKAIIEQLQKGDVGAITLTNRDKASYLRAQELVRPLGIPLEIVALHYAESVRILGSDRVLEACKYFKRKNDVVAEKTVSEVFREMVEDARARKLSARYIEDIEYRCGKFAASCQMPISMVTSEQVREFLASLKHKDKKGNVRPLSPRSHNNFIGALKRLFAFALDRRYVARDFDEMDGIAEVKDVSGEVEIFTPAELRRLLAAASADALPVIAIGAFAGLRSAEMERLDWSEVNLPQRYIKVTAEKGKTASRRIVPITDNLARWLRPYANREGKVWPHSHAYFYEAMRDTAKATKTNKQTAVQWKRNALRHSFVSYRLAAIQDVNQVALESGNSPAMIFGHYRELVTKSEARDWFSIAPTDPAKR